MAKTSERVPRSALAYPAPPGFNGHLLGPYRWFTGRPMNGHRYTDATFLRYGTMATDLSGRASSYQLLPGYKRFLYARLPVMLAPPAAVAAVAHPEQTALLGLGLATLGVRELDKARRARRFRRQVTEPLASAVANVLRARNVAGMGHTWVHVPADFRDDDTTKIRIRLPMDWVGEDGDKARLARVVQQRLQVEELSPAWSLHGAVPFVEFTVPPKPPAFVDFLEMLADADACPDSEVILGAGPREKTETFSLTLESPHALIAGGSGAGKSELLAWIVGQFMRRGYGVAVLDAKFTSHMWLRRVPGVLYASEAEELHDALVWLDEELVRRARFVANGGDPSTLVPMVVLAEEMNSAANRLRQYWNSIKETGQGQSPALLALANLASMGRELRIHIFMAGQSLTAKSVGGPEGRESFGGRMFARATTKQWAMLAPQIKPAPVKRNKPGRWHVVVGDTLREFQVPFVDLKEDQTPGAVARLIEWATAGAPVPDVVAMMATGQGEGVTRRPENTRSEATSPAGISLRLYAQEKGLELDTLRRWKERRSDFPVEIGEGANRTKLYDAGHLDAFVAGRLREPATMDEE